MRNSHSSSLRPSICMIDATRVRPAYAAAPRVVFVFAGGTRLE
jgi:hypothetical protein